MGTWVSLLPYIVGAQALGVGLAWSVDSASWKWRLNVDSVFELNLFHLIFSFLLAVAWYADHASFTEIFWTLSAILFWLGILAAVQRRQMKIPLGAAFFGALMQLFCFGWTMLISVLLLYSVIDVHRYWAAGFYLVFIPSALLTHMLLSLFRPTIYGTWNTARQNGKNRRVR